MYDAHTEMGKPRACSEVPTAWLGRQAMVLELRRAHLQG